MLSIARMKGTKRAGFCLFLFCTEKITDGMEQRKFTLRKKRLGNFIHAVESKLSYLCILCDTLSSNMIKILIFIRRYDYFIPKRAFFIIN